MMMNLFKSVALVTLAISSLAYGQVNEVAIRACGTVINQPGSYYLSQDIVCRAGTEIAISIKNVSRVSLDLKGHSISRIGSAGMLVGGSVEIKDSSQISVIGTGAKIIGMGKGILVHNSQDVSIAASARSKMLLSGNHSNVTTTSSSNVTFSNIVIQNSLEAGFAIQAFGTNGLRLIGIDVNAPKITTGFYLGELQNTEISMSNIVNLKLIGIYLRSSTNTKISNVAVSGSQSGLIVSQSTGLNIANAQINVVSTGIQLGPQDSTNVVIQNSVVQPNSLGYTRAICIGSTTKKPILINTTPANPTVCW